MNKRYVIYDDYGFIKHSGSCAERDFDKQLDAHEGMFILEGYADPDEHYVVGGDVVAKELLDTSFIVDGLTVFFNNLASGVLVIVSGETVVSDSTGVSVEFDSPGTYWVRFCPGPEYKRVNLEVTVG